MLTQFGAIVDKNLYWQAGDAGDIGVGQWLPPYCEELTKRETPICR